MFSRTPLLVAILGASTLTLTACDDDNTIEQTPEVTIPFGAAWGTSGQGEPQLFEAGTCVEGVGMNEQSVRIDDLRFYVADVEARTQEGEWVALELADRDWQGEGVTLIDLSELELEASTGGYNNFVQGTLPEADYDRLRFTLGVPFEQNHSNAPTAPAPMNVTGMFWSWQGGRKFIRIDGQTCSDTDQSTRGVMLHLGSTQCQGEMINITGCDNENRSVIEVDWTHGETILLDLQALYEDVDFEFDEEALGSVCMAAPDDLECAPYFSALGLPFGEDQASAPRVFVSTRTPIEAKSRAGNADEHDDHGDHGDHGDHDHHH